MALLLEEEIPFKNILSNVFFLNAELMILFIWLLFLECVIQEINRDLFAGTVVCLTVSIQGVLVFFIFCKVFFLHWLILLYFDCPSFKKHLFYEKKLGIQNRCPLKQFELDGKVFMKKICINFPVQHSSLLQLFPSCLVALFLYAV